MSAHPATAHPWPVCREFRQAKVGEVEYLVFMPDAGVIFRFRGHDKYPLPWFKVFHKVFSINCVLRKMSALKMDAFVKRWQRDPGVR